MSGNEFTPKQVVFRVRRVGVRRVGVRRVGGREWGEARGVRRVG